MKQENNWDKLLNDNKDVILPKSAFISKMLYLIFRPFFKYFFKIEKINRNFLDVNEATILVANHSSFLDAFIINDLIGFKNLQNYFFIARAEYFESKFMKFVANNGNVILIDANKNLRSVLKICAKALSENKKIILFPEGTRTFDGEIGEFKKTFALLAKKLSAKVVPLVLHGAFESWPRKQKFPKFKKVLIEVLDKIEVENLEIEEINEKARLEIINNYNKLSKKYK